MSKILVIGATNIDTNYYLPLLPKPGESVHCISDKASSLGGKGLNQATAASRAGAKVSFLSCLGKDKEADYILSHIDMSLDAHFEQVDKATGSATILVEESGENEVIVDSGANKELTVSVLEKNRFLFEEASFILLQNEMPFSSNEWILRKYGEEKHILYNPSPLCDIPADLYPYMGTLVVNELEAKTLAKVDSKEEAVARLSFFGAKRILLTLGGKGSALYENGEETVFVPAQKVDVVDTVGAGDTYAGYFVAALALGLSDKEAMSLATFASALSVTKKGAISSIPTLKEVLSFIKK